MHAALQPRQEAATLQALLEEQRRTNRLLRAVLWVCFGFVAGLVVAQLVLRMNGAWH